MRRRSLIVLLPGRSRTFPPPSGGASGQSLARLWSQAPQEIWVRKGSMEVRQRARFRSIRALRGGFAWKTGRARFAAPAHRRSDSRFESVFSARPFRVELSKIRSFGKIIVQSWSPMSAGTARFHAPLTVPGFDRWSPAFSGGRGGVCRRPPWRPCPRRQARRSRIESADSQRMEQTPRSPLLHQRCARTWDPLPNQICRWTSREEYGRGV